MTAELYCGDCLEVMKDWESEIIDLTVTSPPYDNLRTYNGYSFDFEGIAKQLYRVTKPGGVVVWVVGDATINGGETGTSFKQALFFKELGFNLHDTMIYQKAGMRYPDKKRYHAVFEYMFVLSKGCVKTLNAIEDRKNIWCGQRIARERHVRDKDGSMKPNAAWRNDKNRRVKDFGKRNNIWRYSSGSENASGRLHPAVFPEALARDHIISWSNPGDLVLDPMCGSGTTGKMAVKLERNFIGIDVSGKYLDIARRRIRRVQMQPTLFGVGG